MTPAQQLRATMQLLEDLAAADSNINIVDQLLNTAIAVPELDEGLGGRSILAAMIAAAGMSLASGAAAATPTEDARCAGALIALNNVDQARGNTKHSAMVKDIADQLGARAGQGGVTGAEFQKQAGGAFNTVKQFIESGREDQARNYGIACINSLKSGSTSQTGTQGRGAEQSRDQANRQHTINNARAAGATARSLMANGMAAQAQAVMAPYNNGPDYARQAAWAAYNGQR